MKLITFQSLDAVRDLFEKGYIECDKNRVNLKKMGKTYEWITKKMNEQIDNPHNACYPLWCWVKCYNSICPPKRKGDKIEGFDVKITFNKDENEVFITDFIRYSFLLNNTYIPNNNEERNLFDKKLKEYNITKEELKAYVRKDKYKECRTDRDFLNICDEIENTFDRCITKDSNILQWCVWRISLSEIDKIELIKDEDYTYGSVNYIRSNGKRMDWQEQYYKHLK